MSLRFVQACEFTMNVVLYPQVGECEIKSQTLVVCKVPRAPQGVADELFCTNGSSECSGCIRKTAVLNLDNVQDVFEIEFYTDPEIHHIDEENDVIKLKSSQRRLKISVCLHYNCIKYSL